MPQTLAIVVGAEIHDSHRQYRGLLSRGSSPRAVFGYAAPPQKPQRILLRQLRQARLRRLPPRRAVNAKGAAEGFSSAAKVLDLKVRLRCRGCGRKGRAVVSVKWKGTGWVMATRLVDASEPDHREGSGAGWGDHLDAAPRPARPGRIMIAKPGCSTRRRSTNCLPQLSQ